MPPVDARSKSVRDRQENEYNLARSSAIDCGRARAVGTSGMRRVRASGMRVFSDRPALMSDVTTQDHFRVLLRQVQHGSPEAARELYETYVEHVLCSVRSRLWQRMRSKYDSQDFSQQVWASFFDDRERLPDFDTPEALVSYLVGMAFHKVSDEGRQLQAQKRDMQREERIDLHSPLTGPHPASRDPTPSAVAVYHEQYDRLVEQQPPRIRRIVELRLSGKTFEEIAAELDIDESTARRVIKRLQVEVRGPEPGPVRAGEPTGKRGPGS